MIRLKKKRFVKLLMGAGCSRNHANSIATLVTGFKFNLFGRTVRLHLTYDKAWFEISARARAMESVAKGGDSTEA